MILVVDDDKNIRLSLKLILERNEYEVALAEGPKEAMQIVRNTPAVELVLMDMNYTRAIHSRGNRHLGYSSRHTQIPVPATTLDKLNGSRLFLQSMSDLPVTGIVATHDLELSKMQQESPDRFHNYCFEIQLSYK